MAADAGANAGAGDGVDVHCTILCGQAHESSRSRTQGSGRAVGVRHGRGVGCHTLVYTDAQCEGYEAPVTVPQPAHRRGSPCGALNAADADKRNKGRALYVVAL